MKREHSSRFDSNMSGRADLWNFSSFTVKKLCEKIVCGKKHDEFKAQTRHRDVQT